jgi:hypothetical protein
MKLDIELDPVAVGSSISRNITVALTRALEESLGRYGTLGADLKRQVDHATIAMVSEVLSDAGFRTAFRSCLRAGILKGVEGRGERIAKGMPLQQALILAEQVKP